MPEEVDNLANDLSASMIGIPLEEYLSSHENLYKDYNRLSKVVGTIKVRCMNDYRMAMAFKGTLSSLSCYVFNSKKPDWEKFWEVEAELGKKLYSFVKNNDKAEDNVRPFLKYLCSTWHFTVEKTEDRKRMIRFVLGANRIFKHKHSYAVTGLHFAVGDNTFSVGYNGKQYRQYNKVCAFQAFYVNGVTGDVCRGMEAEGVVFPELDEGIYELTTFGNYKGSSKLVFSKDEKREIIDFVREGG